MARLNFTPLKDHKPGTLLTLLERSYLELTDAFPERWTQEKERWLEFDTEAFNCPATIAACVFVTCLEDHPIGFGSFQPLDTGKEGLVGHNCILPEFRLRGFGSRQLAEVVRRMKARGVQRITVTSHEHPFFLAAREMYVSFGFVETGRRSGGPDPDYKLIDYELATREETPDADWEA
jgi:GNAT superfamily N-acetyltransferase